MYAALEAAIIADDLRTFDFMPTLTTTITRSQPTIRHVPDGDTSGFNTNMFQHLSLICFTCLIFIISAPSSSLPLHCLCHLVSLPYHRHCPFIAPPLHRLCPFIVSAPSSSLPHHCLCLIIISAPSFSQP